VRRGGGILGATALVAAWVCLAPLTARGATCVWKAGSAANFNASTANWSCGAIPGSSDNVYFCSGSGSCPAFQSGSTASCSITSAVNVASLSLYSTYSGTVSASGNSVDVVGDFTQAGGTFSAPTSALTVRGAFNRTGGTFTHNSGYVTLAATSSKAFASNGAAFYNLQIINDGLVGYWKLDDTATPAGDSSGFGNSLTWSNSATSSTTVPAMNFTDARSLSLAMGTRDAATASMPSSLQFPAPISLSAWYSATSTDSAGGSILSLNDAAMLTLTTSGVLCGKYAGSFSWPSVTASPSGYLNGNWHHLACVIGTSGMTLYFDGAQVASNSDTSAVVWATPNGGTLAIGRHAGNLTDRDFNGKIDDVRVYNRALSQSEITTLAGGNVLSSTTGTLSLTGNPSVANDLVIATSGLSAGSASLSVSGNWSNYGGTFTAGTSTVTFNGSSSGKSILTNGQAFRHLSISGAGAWSIADASTVTVPVSGTFAQSNGTFTSAAGLLKVSGAWNATGGTFTHNDGTVMLASTSNQTFASNGATFKNLVINDGLAGYWKLDEGSGTTVGDASGYGRSGTLTNSPTWATSSLPSVQFTDGAAVTLNGTTQYVDVTGPATTTNTAFTACAWVKFSALTGNHTFVSIDGSIVSAFSLKRDSGTSKFQMVMAGSDAVSPTFAYTTGMTTVPVTGTWYHVCGMYTGSLARVYVNGAQEGTDAAVSAAFAATGNTIIGTAKYNSVRTDYTPGTIDEVRIYSRVLTSAEINALYLGHQPGTFAATQTLTGSPTVSGDFTLASGYLDLGSNSMSVAGNWWNYGGLLASAPWAGATVTFTGSAQTNVIRSAGQMLPSLTFNGSGKWTLADNLDVDPLSTVTMTSGTLDLSTRTARIGSLAAGSGTLTTANARVVLDRNYDQSLSFGTYNDLRIEDATETNLVGYWKLDEAQGSYARDWSGIGHTAVLTNAATWTITVPPAVEFFDPAALKLASASYQYANAGTGVVSTNAAFSACAWVKFNSVNSYNSVLAANGANVPGLVLNRDAAGQFAVDMRASDSTGSTGYHVIGTTTVATGTWYHVCGIYDGSKDHLYVNGSEEGTAQTVSATWNATGNFTIGAALWSAALVNYVDGTIDDVRVYNIALSATQVKALANGRYAGTGGTATYTLGANLTANGTFDIDSGGLKPGGYTVTAGNGLTVRNGGTLTLDTSSGAVAIAANKTLTIDGTLNASSAGATIKSVSGTYTFRVGSTATATPTVNISGLAIKNTDTNGLNINQNTSASTTITRLDNVAFSSGTGTCLLQIYATSLSLTSTGCTFDASASYAVKLTGNGGTTRALFGGALCPSSLCASSNKSDDDANNDGVADHPGSNGAVVQFVRAAPSDTAGSIEGFPTAAFDWNTFAYYSTYVAYRNFSGSQDRLFVRANSGAASYSWDLPTAAGHFVGTPRWTQISATHYVYVGTTSGYVYKLVDDGGSLALAPSPWDTPYCYGGSPCSANDSVTSPLMVDGTNVYWVGTDSSSNRKFFILTHGKALTSASLSIPAVVTATPALATISSLDYLFAGMQGYLYKIKISDQSATSWSQPATTSTINGRVTTGGGLVYLPDNMGYVYAVNSTTLITDWSYQDTGTHGSCTDGGSCTIKNLYLDAANARVMYGDQDGHLYVISKNGAGATVMAGYPLQPAAGEAFTAAPLYADGIIVAGTSSGSLFVINRMTTATGTPALLATYKLGSAVSTVSLNASTNGSAGAYMVGTANGKLFFIDKVSDSDSYK
jgi:hypothetical protein